MIRCILSVLVVHATAWSPRRPIGFTLHMPARKILLRTISRDHGMKYGHHRAAHSDNDPFKGDESLNPHLCYDIEAGSRRSFIKFASSCISGIISSSGPMSMHLARPENSNAMGLVTFPCFEGSLMNKYHVMRAGQSLLEEENILSTNPLFLTNRDDALTTLGVAQVEDACTDMMAKGINPSVVKYSLASKCIDSANIVATRMMIGRNRIVPEFTFMDPRGIGIWDGGPNELAIWALDNDEAGVEGRDGRPPANDDGTANETLHEQMIRLRQLMSVLETQYSGDSILLIFPDGTSPALLSSLIAGIPLKDTHALNFEPGEVRLDVNMASTLELYKDRVASPKYNEMLEVGQQQLETLRKDLILKQAKENAPPAPVPVSKPPVSTKKIKKQLDIPEDGTDFYAAGTMAVIASMTLVRKGREEEITDADLDTTTETIPELAYANGCVNATTPLPLDIETRTYYKGSNIVEEVPVLSKEERRKAADQAMEKYLNQDDGGEDWIRSMKDIMDEKS